MSVVAFASRPLTWMRSTYWAELAATCGTALILAAAPAGNGQRRPIPVEVVQDSTSPFTIAKTVLEPILGPLETTVIVLIVAIFVLMQKEDLRDRFIRVFGSTDLHRTTLAMDDAGKRLSKYFLSQLGVNTGFGIVIGLGLWGIGIPSPAMWGILAGLLRFVPYIGSMLAAVAPMAPAHTAAAPSAPRRRSRVFCIEWFLLGVDLTPGNLTTHEAACILRKDDPAVSPLHT